MLDEVDDAALVLECHRLFFTGAFVGENNFKVLVEERHGLQTLHDGARNKLNSFRRKDDWVWIERHRCSGLATASRCFAFFGQLAFWLATIFKRHGVAVAATVDFQQHLC